MVFVVPSYGIFGASGRVATAAVAEGVRALARSAALAEAVAVNCVVADREDVSAAVRALEAGGLTGQTLLLDGGLL